MIIFVLECCKVTETKFRLCYYSYWNIHASNTKRNALFNLIKTFTKSQRVSDSFENITVKYRFFHCRGKQTYRHIFKYAMVEKTNIWLLDILVFKNSGQSCRTDQSGSGSAINSTLSQCVSCKIMFRE